MSILDWIKAWFDLPGGTNKLDSFYANDTQVVIVINQALLYITGITGDTYTVATSTTPDESVYDLDVKTAITYYMEYDMCLKSTSAGGSSLTNADKITIKDMSHTVIKESTSGSGDSSGSIACEDWLSKIDDVFPTSNSGLSFATFVRS